MSDSTEITVKIVKDFKGSVTVRSDGVLGDLLQAIEGAGLPASQVANFIIRGKRVDAQSSADVPLSQLGVTNNSTVMLVRRTEGEIAAARAILRDQGYTNESHAMRSLNIETILVIWLNLVQADPVCKFRLPDFVYAARVQKS